MRQARILLIEKDEGVRTVVSAVLERAEYEVIDVGDALEGLKRMYKRYHDLVIMADEILGANVEELCHRLRWFGYMPIIVLGGKSNEEAAQILDSGADAYLRKGHNYPELVARVRSLLRRRREHGSFSGGDSDCDPGGCNTRRGNGDQDLTLI